MICWKCLTAVDWEKQGDCHLCGAELYDNYEARADRFMELLKGRSVPDAILVLGDIERRVLDGTLWEGEKP